MRGYLQFGDEYNVGAIEMFQGSCSEVIEAVHRIHDLLLNCRPAPFVEGAGETVWSRRFLCRNLIVCSISSSVNCASIVSSSSLHRFNLVQSNTCARFLLVPSKLEKKWYRMSSFSSCYHTMSSVSDLRYAIRFLLRRPFARWWKYFVHASPSLMLIILEICQRHDRSIAAHPKTRCLSCFMSSSSGAERLRVSWAMSRRRITSLANSSCVRASLNSVLLHSFRLCAVFCSLLWRIISGLVPCTGLIQAAATCLK